MPPPEASRVDEITTLKRAPAPSAPALAEEAIAQQALRSQRERPSAADGLTLAVAPEATVETAPAVQMPDRPAELSVQIGAPKAGHERMHTRSWWL